MGEAHHYSVVCNQQSTIMCTTSVHLTAMVTNVQMYSGRQCCIFIVIILVCQNGVRGQQLAVTHKHRQPSTLHLMLT
eukprot:COSAG02_NODE_2457_length_8810_cov_4.343933_8_plen_77_part_00